MPSIARKIRKSIMIIVILAIVSTVGLVSIRWIGTTLYPLQYKDSIEKYSKEYDIDPFLVASVIRVESRYYENAKSHVGATGLMQITPSTGEWIAEQIGIEGFNPSMLLDPKVNIMMGCWYLNNLKEQFGNMKLVLAAYNGGRGNVVKWLKDTTYSMDGESLYDIPFKETKDYVEKVEKAYKIYSILYDKDQFY